MTYISFVFGVIKLLNLWLITYVVIIVTIAFRQIYTTNFFKGTTHSTGAVEYTD